MSKKMVKRLSPEEQEKMQSEHETAVVELMAKAQGVARKIFSEQPNALLLRATLEIYDYLKYLDGDEENEKGFAADLLRVREHAKAAFDAADPSPEQVFELFDRIFNDDEDEE